MIEEKPITWKEQIGVIIMVELAFLIAMYEIVTTHTVSFWAIFFSGVGIICSVESRIDIETKQRELTDLKLSEFGSWAKRREQDFIDIERIADELKQDEQVRKDGI